MCNIDDNFISNKYENDLNDKCKECNKILLYNSNDSELFCKSCGYTEKIMIVSKKDHIMILHRN